MEIISDLTKQFAQDIVKHRRYNYSQQSLYNFLQNNQDITCNGYRVPNKRNQNLQVSIFFNKQYSKSKTCIVYAHGLGSNKIQILPIVQNFKKLSCFDQNQTQIQSNQFHICSFDFSSSGRSQGQNTTYGIRQQDDVISILSWLDSLKKYQRYILWGRSMGASSVILSQSQQFNPKISCIILDSPFSSFEKVALQLANKKFMIPTFMAEILIQPLKNYIDKNYPFNPFSIDTKNHIKNINCKILFMYSKNDNVVDHQHSLILKKNCKKTPFEIQLVQDHNSIRSKQTMKKIAHFIQDSIKANNRQQRICESMIRNRGISLTSKQKDRQKQRKMSACNSKRGIFNVTQKRISIDDTHGIESKLLPYAGLKLPNENRMYLSRQLDNKKQHKQSIKIHSRKSSQQNIKQCLQKKLLGISQSYQSLANHRKNSGLNGSHIQSYVYNYNICQIKQNQNNYTNENEKEHKQIQKYKNTNINTNNNTLTIINHPELQMIKSIQIQNIQTVNSMDESNFESQNSFNKNQKQNNRNSINKNYQKIRNNNNMQKLVNQSYADFNDKLQKRNINTNNLKDSNQYNNRKAMVINSICQNYNNNHQNIQNRLSKLIESGKQSNNFNNTHHHINMLRKNRFR